MNCGRLLMMLPERPARRIEGEYAPAHNYRTYTPEFRGTVVSRVLAGEPKQRASAVNYWHHVGTHSRNG